MEYVLLVQSIFFFFFLFFFLLPLHHSVTSTHPSLLARSLSLPLSHSFVCSTPSFDTLFRFRIYAASYNVQMFLQRDPVFLNFLRWKLVLFTVYLVHEISVRARSTAIWIEKWTRKFSCTPRWHGLDDVLKVFFWPKVLNSHLRRQHSHSCQSKRLAAFSLLDLAYEIHSLFREKR